MPSSEKFTDSTEKNLLPTPKSPCKASEVAKLCGVTSATVLNWAKENRLPCIRFTTRVIRFDRQVVDDFIAARTEAQTA